MKSFSLIRSAIHALLAAAAFVSAVPAPAQLSAALQWSRARDGGAARDDFGMAAATDAAGNVYVLGRSHNGTNFDYLTVKCYELFCGRTFCRIGVVKTGEFVPVPS